MSHRVCPWWLGYLLTSRLRRLFQNPDRIVRPYVRAGMVVLDAGCGMGFFSLPLARLVSKTGKVVCVDLQDRMIGGLIRRARKAGLFVRIDARICDQTSLKVEINFDIQYDKEMLMKLSVEEANLFCKLMWGLQFYVNQQHQILPNIKSAKEFHLSLPTCSL